MRLVNPVVVGELAAVTVSENRLAVVVAEHLQEQWLASISVGPTSIPYGPSLAVKQVQQLVDVPFAPSQVMRHARYGNVAPPSDGQTGRYIETASARRRICLATYACCRAIVRGDRSVEEHCSMSLRVLTLRRPTWLCRRWPLP
jgi:hypothetical protein